ncbi:MAG: rod shape-determining protein [Deltaproteobacteria bacterium]|nr:rod shape-determining protein [Deltaproteobacteria bacterium]
MRFFQPAPLDVALELSATEIRLIDRDEQPRTLSAPAHAFPGGAPRQLALLRAHLPAWIGRRGAGVLVAGHAADEATWRRVLREAGAARAVVLPAPVLAAVGADLPVMDPEGLLVLDLGHSHFTATLLSGGVIWAAATVPSGIAAILTEVQERFAHAYGVRLSTGTASALLSDVGLLPAPGERMLSGREQRGGHPVSLPVDPSRLMADLRALQLIRATAAQVLETCSPELAADLLDRGAVAVGGGALLPGAVELLTQATSLPVRIADTPRYAVARGARRALGDLDLLARLTGEPEAHGEG